MSFWTRFPSWDFIKFTGHSTYRCLTWSKFLKAKEDKIKNSKDNNNKYFLILKLNNKLKININIKVNIALLSPLTIVPKIISKKEIKKKYLKQSFFLKIYLE